MTTPLPIPGPIAFSDDANEEHGNILRAKTKSAMAGWELGVRLQRFKQTGEWKRVTVGGGGYESFVDYLARGCGVSAATARVYMRAAELPRPAALRLGIHGAAMLSSLVELTEQEETLDEALALMVEAEDGSLKPFAEMTFDEREDALARARANSNVRVRGAGRPSAERVAADAFRDRVRTAVAPWVKAGQVQAKVIDGQGYFDLKAVPAEQAADVFEAIAGALEDEP